MSELKTLGREYGDKAVGMGMFIGGIFAVILGIIGIVYVGDRGGGGGAAVVAVIAMFAGVVLTVLGHQKMRKAEHIAWTREALERHDESRRQ